ncbi:MAG TPA: hypothetical protein DDW52_09565 [Planctomycetaceae bacterium]|nr:hypothetical protein [Planctomycetaceae bacterium]
MLANDDRETAAVASSVAVDSMVRSAKKASAKHRVVLPDEMRSTFFDVKGYLPTTAYEARRQARLSVRREAKIEFEDLPSGAIKDLDGEHYALVKDFSRGGISILYHQQLFPEDRFVVFFQSGAVTASAVRCRKLGPSCYEIGAQIVCTELND